MQREVLASFTAKTDTLVADLNTRMPWKETLAIVAPNSGPRVRKLTTTPVYVEIRSSAVDAEIPDLPAEATDLRAPIELWVLGEPRPAVAAELLALWGLSKMVLPAVEAAAAEAIDRATGDAAATQSTVRGFEPERLGQWWVLRLGADLMKRVLGEPATSGTAGNPS